MGLGVSSRLEIVAIKIKSQPNIFLDNFISEITILICGVAMRPKRVYLSKLNERNDSVIAWKSTASTDTVTIVRFLSNGRYEKQNGEQNRRRALFRILFVFICGKCGRRESRKSSSLCRRARWNVRSEYEIMQPLLYMRKRSRCSRTQMPG